jgi:ParB/RepB/Spo0J family partition protein
MQTEVIAISKLRPHPDNPRLFLREDVVSGICEQIKAKGFEDRHAPHVRKVDGDGFYQIVSGHQRTESAKRAGVKKIPCVVVEMTDEEAFRELLLSNVHGELSNLEIGLHVLKAVERGRGGRGKKGGISAWSEEMGKTRQLVQQYVNAASVIKHEKNLSGFTDYVWQLEVIHRAHESDWPALVAAMLKGDWSKDTTELRVEAVKQFTVPDDLADIYPRARVVAQYLNGFEFAPATLAKLVEAVRRAEGFIKTYESSIDVASYLAQFRAWLAEDQNAWDLRKINKRVREIHADLDAAEVEASRRWNQGDWRQAIDILADGSVALLLTDPPYGIDFQSDHRLDRSQPHRHEEIARDDAAAAAEFEECARLFYPKMAENAHLLCFCHWSTEPLFRVAIEKAGYALRGSLVWVKNNTGMGDPNTTFAPKHERILHAVKGSPMLFRREPDVLDAARVESDRHPTEKPIGLLSRLIEAVTVEGELVADPFAGVASTLVAAKKAKRLYWGCEISPTYFAAGSARLVDEEV